MNFRSAAIILAIQIITGGWVFGQAYFNFEDAYNATPICDLSLIHGRQFTNPVFMQTKGDLACGMGGKEDNIIIFPFIATATNMSITITGQSCTNPSTLRGLQGGIMQDTAGMNCIAFYANLVMVGTTADFSLTGNNFIPGNKYYLWLDGNGGSSCTFTLNVTQGNNAAPTLKDIAAAQNILNGIVGNGLFTDTIAFCVGPDTLKMEIPADGLDLSYEWFLQPGPGRVNVDTIINHDNKLELFFDTLGTYQIKVVATNGCTFTDTLRMTVIVTDLPPVEVFPEIMLCPENAGQLQETLRLYDPNGDGFFGFGGIPEIFNGDSIRSSVINKFNCNIQQVGRAIILNPPVAGRDTVVACGSYTLPNGGTITSTQSVNIKVGSSVVTGCDSTKLSFIYIPQIDGNLDLRVCRGLNDEIVFIAGSTAYLPDDTLRYIWKRDGMPVTDTDGIDTILTLDKVRGTYSIEIYSEYRGSKCLIYSNAIDYLGADLGPAKPSVGLSDTLLCPGENIITAQVKIAMAEGYIWNIPPGVEVVFLSAREDSIVLDFSKLPETTVALEVAARNGCDTTEFVLSSFITKSGIPNMAFQLPGASCITSTVLLATIGNATSGYSYRWTIQDATLASGDVAIFDTLQINFTNDGPKLITLTATSALCGDSTVSDSILIAMEPVYITPTCRSDANSIIISWLDQECLDGYEVFADDQSLGIVDTISFKLDNLNSNTSIKFRIEGINVCGCDNISFFATCSTIDCAAIDLESSISDTVICEGEATPLILSGEIPGLYPGGFLSYSGPFTDSLGNIDASKLAAGSQTFKVNYLFEGCNVANEYNVMVRPKPEFLVEYNDVLCAGENQTPYTITSRTEDQMQFTIDGNFASASGFLTSGTTPSFVGTDFAGCTSTQMIAVVTKTPDGFEIVGKTDIFDNEILELYLKAAGNTTLDSARWLVNGANRCQTAQCLELINFNLVPGTYNHEIRLYLNGCSTDTSFVVTVDPSFKLFLPNAFSPEALDFDNQIFSLKTSEFNGAIKSFRIFSRWGEMVHNQTSNQGDDWSWNGTMSGKPIAKGVYVYVVEYEDEQGRLQLKTGDVTIY